MIIFHIKGQYFSMNFSFFQLFYLFFLGHYLAKRSILEDSMVNNNNNTVGVVGNSSEVVVHQ